MTEIIGWIGGAGFAVCAMPQVHKCYKQGHAHGISYLFLLLWTLGEVCTLVYVLLQDLTLREQAPLLLNYIVNLICMIAIWRYRLFPKQKQHL